MTNENKSLLTKSESAALRGIAILGIVLHNYCHFLSFAIKENEYTFKTDRPAQFLDKLINFDITHLFIHLFSFLGHYGVPIFLFISGYGLVMKYEKTIAGRITPVSFMRYHYLKLFRLMIIGYLVFVAIYCLRAHNAAEVYSWDRVLTQLTMIINFCYAEPNHIIKPGPYWFFGLMLQLYALYILLLHRRGKWWITGAIMVSWLIQLAAPTETVLNYVRYNFIGGVLPFATGILYARHGININRKAYFAIMIISGIAVIFGSLYAETWLWVPLFVVTGAVSTIKLIPRQTINTCAWFGGLSSAMFVMHPVVREVVITHYRRTDIYYGIAVYLLAAVALSMLLQYILKFIPNPKLKS